MIQRGSGARGGTVLFLASDGAGYITGQVIHVDGGWVVARWRRCNNPQMPGKATPESESELVDAIVEDLAGWRGELLSRLRDLIKQAVPDVVEEVKWRKASNPLGVPVWSHEGIICTGESYKDKVKLTFAKGASVEDPSGLFNASMDAKERRAIDLHQGDELDEGAFKALVRNAAELNGR